MSIFVGVFELGFLLGIAGLAAMGAGAVAFVVLRLTGTSGRRLALVASLASATAAATWLLFAFEWLLYAVAENGPAYYSFSPYVEYRRALDRTSGVAIGLGYSLLGGALVVAASTLRSRIGSWWALPAALAAAGSVALPAVVPAALPRAEVGRDAVFYLADGGTYEDPASGRTVACFGYGVEQTGPTALEGEPDPKLCLQFRRSPVARRLYTNPSPPSTDALSAYDLADALNESGYRPYDQVEDLGIEGLEIAHAEWRSAPSQQLARPPLVSPADIDPPVGDRATKREVLRVARYMEACGRRQGTYVPCAEPRRLRRVGIQPGGVESFEVSNISGDGYTVTGESVRGTVFTFQGTRSGRAVRVCTPGGEGGCRASGNW